MTEQEIFSRLNEIFRDVFDDQSITVGPTTDASMIEEWDSLMHISLIVATEVKFGIKFRSFEIDEMKNVGDFAQLILERLT